MPDWAPTTISLAYAGIVMLLALSAVFSETNTRREAAYKVLRVLLPWTLLAAVAQTLTRHTGIGA